MRIEFYIPGNPRTKGSKTRVRGHLVEQADMAKRGRGSGALKSWMQAIAFGGSLHRAGAAPAQAAVEAWVRFYIPRPASVRRRFPSTHGTGDVDKQARAVLDALEGILFPNDAQVTDLHSSKRYVGDDGTTEPGARIRLELVGDEGSPWPL